jgi:diketogulonate reductase-like aldo/keto reductase
MTAKGARLAVISSLDDMKIEYLDLVLIHWPGVKGKPLTSPVHREQRFEVFQELLALREEGFVKHVGVSNFTVRHLQQLSEDCQRVGIADIPFLNQFEMHPLCAQVTRNCIVA